MARLVLDLPADVSIALRRAANDVEGDRETVAMALLKDALVAGGWLDQAEIEDDSETSGNA